MIGKPWIRGGLLILAGMAMGFVAPVSFPARGGIVVPEAARARDPGPPAEVGRVQTASEATVIDLEPEEVEAGMFFDGATIRVEALVPEGMGVSVSCTGDQEPVILSRKGKVLGLIWMNVGEVEIEGAPELYLLHTSVPLDEMATPTSLSSAGVGYRALEGGLRLHGTEGQEHLYFQEFVNLKESDGLYAVAEETVEELPADGGKKRVRAVLRLPPKTPTGDYRLQIHGFRGDQALVLGTAGLRVRQVGLAATIRTLATDHGLAYGILAVAVAIVVGLLTGVLFGLGSKKAH